MERSEAGGERLGSESGHCCRCLSLRPSLSSSLPQGCPHTPHFIPQQSWEVRVTPFSDEDTEVLSGQATCPQLVRAE